jgi:putative DNA primase/helicase
MAEPGRRPWLVDQAEKVVLANYAHWGLFQRGDMLVRAMSLSAADVEKERRTIRRPAGAVVLRRITAPMIEDTFGRAVRWINVKEADIDCPAKVALIYLSREGMWRLPHLTGIVGAPIMRADGSILTTAGYDEATGLLLQSPIAWPALPAPSLDAARAAVKCLMEPFSQFPFSTPAGWSVLLSAILTGLQRRLLPSAPAHAFDATAQGAGKSLLGDSVSLIVVGIRWRRCPPTRMRRSCAKN